MIRTMIWDCDGTLVDSRAMIDLFYDGYHRLYPNRPRKDRAEFVPCHGNPDEVNFRMLNILPQHQASFFEFCLNGSSVTDHFRAFPEINQVLFQLKARGIRLGINTSRTQKTIREAQLQLKEAYDLFDFVVTSDQVSHPKPAPDSLLLCQQKAGCRKEEMLYIGDQPVDQQCAEQAGILFALARWGISAPQPFHECLKLDHPAAIFELIKNH